MLKYFHIIKFLMTHDLTKLKEFWEIEVIKNKDFQWWRLFRRYRKSLDMNTQYWFCWRLANEMFLYGNEKQKLTALKLNDYLTCKYGMEIMLGAKIGFKPIAYHTNGIVITSGAKIGNNFHFRQNTTIGVKTLVEYNKKTNSAEFPIVIGDNVSVGANCCIIGDDLTIGSNVIIGAASFIDKNIPDNCTVYTEKTNFIKIKAH